MQGKTNLPAKRPATNPSGIESAVKKCPFCKEQIFEDAIKCKHCSSVLVPIADNFNNGQSGGINQSVQILYPAEKSSYTVQPVPQNNKMLGHGWIGLIIAFLFLSLASDQTGDEAVGVAIVGAIIVIPWMIWLITRPSANKALPAIALVLTTLGLIGSFNM